MADPIEELRSALLTNRLILQWEGFEERQIPFLRLAPAYDIANVDEWYYGPLEVPQEFTEPGSDRLPLVIASRTSIARGLRGDVFRARLATGGPSFVLKVGHGERYDHRGHLHFEATVYDYLHETDLAPHIPAFFGLWTATDGTCATMLILEDVGKPGQGLSCAQFTSDEKKALLHLFEELHHKGVHHGDPAPSNFAVSAPQGERIRLFDFSEASYPDEACDLRWCPEYAHLEYKCRRDGAGAGTDYETYLEFLDRGTIRDDVVHHQEPPF